MKMVKSLLLGTAAGLVAMTGAQAADLPVKAKPVQYVKICSLYGAGFYYIPGTDTCIKVGGWVRMQMGYGFNGNMSNGPMMGNLNNRSTNDFMTRNRGYITADARSQTEYGTLRGYIAVGLNNDNPIPGMSSPTVSAAAGTITAGSQGGVGFSANRAFIQFAGFTAGLSQSMYDGMNYAVMSYYGGSIWTPGGADTGDSGWQVLAYTAQLGNGLSATISAENPRNAAVTGYSSAGTAVTAIPSTVSPTTVSGREGNKFPDVVGNLRIDQAWGFGQVMGAIHDASATYDDSTVSLSTHPSNKLGYALGVAGRVNLPMLGVGDYITAQFNWTKGAIKYATAGSSLSNTQGGTKAAGSMTDGVYLNGASNIELTTAWSVGAGYEHNWNPKWKTSVYGGYAKVDYSDVANTIVNTTGAQAVGANADFSTWQIGTRTAWAPVNNLEVGLDVIYTKLNTATASTVAAGTLTAADQSAWITHLRIQRNFYP